MFREIVFSRSSQNGLSPDPWATFGEHTSWEAAYAVQLKQAIDLARKEPHVAAYAEVARLFDLKQANITDAGRLLAKVLAEYDENGMWTVLDGRAARLDVDNLSERWALGLVEHPFPIALCSLLFNWVHEGARRSGVLRDDRPLRR